MNRSTKYVLAAAMGLVLVGCSDEPVPAPYRGELMAKLEPTGALKQKLEEKYGFDAAKNCIQLVGRDTTKDKIRYVETKVIFSPDACPADAGKVAPREAFALDALRNPRPAAGADGGSAIAYYLVLNTPNTQEIVGNVLVAPSVPAEEMEEATAAPAMSLGDVCTLNPEYEEMCGLVFTNEGRFNQIEGNRVALGRVLRERRNLEGLKRHMEGVRNTLSGQLNQLQTNLVTSLDNRLTVLNVAVKSEQRVLAVKIVENLLAEIDQLGNELNANTNATSQNVFSELRREMRALHAENLRVIRQETDRAIRDTKAAIYDVHTKLKDQIGAAEKAILDRIATGVDEIQTLQNCLHSSLEYDIEQLQTKLIGKIDDSSNAQFARIKKLVRRTKRQILAAMRSEVVAKVDALKKTLDEGILGDAPESLKSRILSRLENIECVQTASVDQVAQDFKEVKEAIEAVQWATGRQVDAATQRLIGRVDAAILVERQATEALIRQSMGPQLRAFRNFMLLRNLDEKRKDMFDELSKLSSELAAGGTPGQQLARAEMIRAWIPGVERAVTTEGAELDEAERNTVSALRVTLRDYVVVAMALEHRALVRDLTVFAADAKRGPRVADWLKANVPAFAEERFDRLSDASLRLLVGLDSESGEAAEALRGRLEKFAKAVSTEQGLRGREQALR